MKRLTLGLALLVACGAAQAASEKVEMKLATEQGAGEAVGTVTISESANGLTFTPDLKGLPDGEHGFHIHANGSCDPKTVDGKLTPAGAADGHFDPHNTGKHLGPEGDGHLGDLPVLTVSQDGSATSPVTAPRLKSLDEIKGKALMIHVGGDNMSDMPKPLGGGGARFACGVIG
ncbi:superoxide dismutase [Cu-Zn] SodC2 [Enterobacteriaceae bacterium BIT-l23]|uniref:superoxide dismutase [Cu-Zn] SodC n=1 Tax=Jejubacter sp. L23 TaxID=3092086 RepID=UPI0015844F84|nr:superoxide dismutase [Cu-Zn] SodC2 [Enterobacteriaceae bacterium BIT-l23]